MANSTATGSLANWRAGRRLNLSWPLPSASFGLQQKSDLTSADWADVTNQPTLNFTNLHHQVTLPALQGRAFYRLKRQ